MPWCTLHCGIKKKMVYVGACVLYCLWQIFMGVALTSELAKPPLLLVVSFDGFRWDYLDMVRQAGRQTPVFDSLTANGVKAKWLENSYVTLTFPNHYSIATGLHEENHGVVSTQMYDPVFQETFDSHPEQLRDEKWWNNGSDAWTGEPIWLTNQHKPNHYSGVYSWAGSEAAIHGEHAKHYVQYNWSTPYTQRIDTMMRWFAQEQDPINLGMLYFEDPDSIGHQMGPESLEMIERIVELDEILSYVVNSAKERDLFRNLNLIVTSDHGMTQLIDTVYLEDYLDKSLKYSAYGRPPVLHIMPSDGTDVEALYKSVQMVPHVRVYKKRDIPAEYHYTHNRRILDIIVEADLGYLVCKDRVSCEYQARQRGEHGYNNSIESMRPIFIAHGPVFKHGYISEPFHNVDIYPLMCHILEVDPAHHDGQFDRIKHILADGGIQTLSDMITGHNQASITAVGVVLGVLFLVFGVYCLIKFGLSPTSNKFPGDRLKAARSESKLLLTKYIAEDIA